MDAKTGRLVAMASYPTYDPDVWAGGISQGDLDRLYDPKGGEPLLARATQGQFAPGSTFKPFMTAGALTHGYSPATRLDCSSSLQVGNRGFKNYESGAYGSIDFAKALQVSCNTFFYRVGYGMWQKYGGDPDDVNAKDPLVEMAKTFGFGTRDRHRPARRGQRADRRPALEAVVLEGQQGLLLQARQGERRGLHPPLRPRVLRRGLRVRRRRRGQLLDRAGRHGDHPAAARDGVRRALQRRHAVEAAGRHGDRVAAGHADQADQAEEGVACARPGQGPALHRPGAARHDPDRDVVVAVHRLPARPGADPLQDRQRRGLRQAVDVVAGVVRQAVRRGHDGLAGRHRVGHVRPGGPQDLGDAVRRPRQQGRRARTRPSRARSRRRRCLCSRTRAGSCRREEGDR